MGLAERRAAKSYRDDHYPDKLAKIREAAGFDVDVEVDWTTLAVDKYTHLYEKGFTAVFFQPIAEALAAIGEDEMGREALKGALKKIVVCNTADKYGANAISFAEGVLTVDHHPVTNINEVQDRSNLIVTLLEKSM